MKISTIMQYLASGELSNLNLAEDELHIKPDKMPVVLRMINRGLEDLYTRFTLKRNVAVLESNTTGLYVVDHPELIEILDVYVNTIKLAEGNQYIKTSVNSFQTSIVLGLLDTISVEYKAKHRLLTELDVMLDTQIDLPSGYINALMYFIAAKLYTGKPDIVDGDISVSMGYENKYQSEIIMLTNQGIDVDFLADNNDSFSRRGFA